MQRPLLMALGTVVILLAATAAMIVLRGCGRTDDDAPTERAREHPNLPPISGSRPGAFARAERGDENSAAAVEEPPEGLSDDPCSPEGSQSTIEPFFGQVLDHRTDRPVVGAEVFVSERFQIPTGQRADATTDPAGLFVLRELDSEASFLVVRAPGFGYYRRDQFREESHGTEASAMIVRLQPAAVLTGRIVDEDGRPRSDVFVNVCPAWVRPKRWRIAPVRWSANPDEEGRFRIDDLWGNTSLGVDLVSHKHRCQVSGSLLLLGERLIQIRPGEQRHIEVRLPRRTATISGFVTDQFGQPLPGEKVVVTKHAVRPSGNLTVFDEVIAVTTADAHGRYQLPKVPVGEWFVGAVATEPDAQPARAERAVASGSAPISVTGARAKVTQNVVLHRGLWVEGRIVDYQGRGVAGARLTVFQEGALTGLVEESGVDGSFRAGPLHVGKYQIKVRPPTDESGGFLLPRTVGVTAGESSVVIQLGLGGEIVSRVIASGESIRDWSATMISRETGRESRPPAYEFGGILRIGPLPEGVYRLMATDKEGFVGLLRDVRVTAGRTTTVPDIDCRTPGGRLRIEIPGVDKVRGIGMVLDVESPGGDRVRSHRVGAVPFMLQVPLGTFRLALRVNGKVRATRSVVVRPGETVPVVFDLGR